MVIHKYINKLVNSFEKHVRVFRKACTCFSENMYVFQRKHVRVLGKICRDLYRPFKNIQ